MADNSLVNIEIDGYSDNVVYSNLRVEQYIGDHHYFKFQWSATDFMADSSKQLDTVQSYLGSSIKISFGDNDFKGIITNITVEERHGSTQTFIISGNSPTILLEDSPLCCSFYKKSLSDIVNATLQGIASNALSTQVSPDNSDTLFYKVQYNQTNFEFLQLLAKRYGEWFYYDGSTLVFGGKGEDCDDLQSGVDLDNFRLSSKIEGLNLSFSGYDPFQGEPLSDSVSGSGSGNDYLEAAISASNNVFSGQSSNSYHIPFSHNKQLLDSLKAVQKNAAVSELVEITGFSKNTSLKVGSDVKISNLDGSVSNKYLLCSVIHFSNVSGHYSNSFVGIPSSVVVPPYTDPFIFTESDEQIAIVKENVDPDCLGRIKVNFSWQQSSDTSPWIRIAHPYGGASGGFGFFPEIGDEVLVCFEEGNVENPYVSGVLYNGKAQPIVTTIDDDCNTPS